MARLGDYICEYSVRNKADDDVPVYSVTNTQGFCTEYFSKDVASKDRTTYKFVPRGYFAYNPSRINVGSIDCQECENLVIVSPLYVVFSVSTELDRRYLLYYLKSDIALSNIKAKATGSVRDNLKFDVLSDFDIALPDLPTQRHIAAVLDKVSDLMAQCKQQLADLDLLVKSRFVEMFGDPVKDEKGWEKQPIKALYTVGSSKRIYASEQTQSGIPFLRVSDICSMIDD